MLISNVHSLILIVIEYTDGADGLFALTDVWEPCGYDYTIAPSHANTRALFAVGPQSSSRIFDSCRLTMGPAHAAAHRLAPRMLPTCHPYCIMNSITCCGIENIIMRVLMRTHGGDHASLIDEVKRGHDRRAQHPAEATHADVLAIVEELNETVAALTPPLIQTLGLTSCPCTHPYMKHSSSNTAAARSPSPGLLSTLREQHAAASICCA